MGFLSVMSPVLAGLKETKRREDGLLAVPFPYDSGVGEKLLAWSYQQKIATLSVAEAKALSELSLKFDMPGAGKMEEVEKERKKRTASRRQEFQICSVRAGLALPCDQVLAGLAESLTALSTPLATGSTGDDLLDLATLAAKCSMLMTLSVCEHFIIEKFWEVSCGANHFRILHWSLKANE